MSTSHDYLVRAHDEARLREAAALRTGDRLVRARRLSRRAERAGRQARLALARLL